MSEPHNFLRYVLSGNPAADTAIGPRVRLQQHLDLSKAVQLMAYITIFNSVIASYVAFEMTGNWHVFIWASTNFFFAGLMLYDYFRKSGRPMPKGVTGRYVQRSEITSIFAGFMFASLPLYMSADAFNALILSSLFTVSMCAGLMCVLPRNPRLVIRYLVGAVLPLVTLVALHFSDRMIAIAIGLSLLLVTIYFGARSSFHLYLKEVKSVEDATRFREILEVSLDGSGQAFAVRGNDGEIIFQNQLYAEVKPAVRNLDNASGLVHALERYWQTARYEVANIGSVEVFTDVTRIEDARQEAESLREDADHASNSKNRFIQSVTTELLVPLRTIRLHASMMDAGSRIPLTKTDMNRTADQIRMLTESLEVRVEQIIGFASGDATQADPAVQPAPSPEESNPVLKLDAFLRRSLKANIAS